MGDANAIESIDYFRPASRDRTLYHPSTEDDRVDARVDMLMKVDDANQLPKRIIAIFISPPLQFQVLLCYSAAPWPVNHNVTKQTKNSVIGVHMEAANKASHARAPPVIYLGEIDHEWTSQLFRCC